MHECYADSGSLRKCNVLTLFSQLSVAEETGFHRTSLLERESYPGGSSLGTENHLSHYALPDFSQLLFLPEVTKAYWMVN